jgi:ankyrin repeat protein
MRLYVIVFLLCDLVVAQRINLPAAIIAGNVDVVDQILFSGDNYNIFSYLTDMIKTAIQNHQWDILESIYKYKNLQDELFDSCANGNLAKFEDLILNHSASPGDGGNMCLLFAIQNGHINIVERLLNDERIPITRNNLNILQALIVNNRLDMMKILLPRLRPQIVSNYALNEACRFGRLEMVELLLQDPRVDPSLLANRAVEIAASGGFDRIVGRLLMDHRVLYRYWE